MRSKVLIFLLLLFVPLGTVSAAEYDYNSKEFQKIVSQLDMQGHANDELSSCKVKQMYYEEVDEMLKEGMTEEEILQSYVDEYGQAALREPATNKSGLLAWGMPVVGVLVGLTVITLWLRKLKMTVKVEEENSAPMWNSELDKEITAKIFEEERRKHF